MNCTIDFTNPIIKADFMERADKVGARAAITSILNEADSNQYLSVEKELRENTLYSEVLGRIFHTSENGIVDTIRAMDMTKEMGQEMPEAVSKVLAEIQKDLQDKMEINAQLYASDGNGAAAQAVASSYTVLSNFGELSKVVANRLATLHKQLSGDDFLYESIENLEDANAEDRSSSDLIHSTDRLTQSTEKFVASEIIALLSTLPNYVFNEGGELSESFDELGFRELGDMQGARAYLTKTLTDKVTFEKMMASIAEDAKTIPQAAGIYKLLTDAFSAKGSRVSVTLGDITKEYYNTENAFHKSFRTVLRGLTTVSIRERERLKKDPNDPDKVTRVKETVASVFNAGEQTRSRDIIKKYYYALDEIHGKSLSTRKSILAELKKKYSTLFEDTNEGKYYMEDGVNRPYADSRLLALSVKHEGKGYDSGINILQQMSEMLEDLGIEANIATLKEYKNSIIGMHVGLQNKSNKSSDEKDAATIPKARAVLNSMIEGQHSLVGELITILTEDVTATSSKPSTRGAKEFRSLANARAAKGEDKILPGSITVGDGTSRNTSNLADNMSDTFTFLGNPESVMHKEYASDPIMKHSYLMELFGLYNKNNPVLEDTSLYDNKKLGIAKVYKDMTTQELFAYELTNFLNITYAGAARTSSAQRILAPTMSDRKHTKVVVLPKAMGTKSIEGEAINPISWANKKAEYVMIKSINTEVARINQVRKEMREFTGEKAALLIPGYNTPNGAGFMFGDKFSFWPELQGSDIFVEVDGYLALNTEKYNTKETLGRAALDAELARLENDFTNGEIAYYTRQGVVAAETKATDKTILLTETMGKLLPTENTGKHGVRASMSRKEFKDMVVLKRAISNDMTILSMGDIAYLGAKAKSVEDLMLPSNKRFGMTGTPGQKVRVGEGGAREKYGVAVFKDIEDFSGYVAEFDSLTKGKKWDGNKTNITDGVGLCTLERLTEILGSMGELTPSVATAIEELNKENAEDINWNRVNGVLDIQKGFYLAQRFDSNYNRVMPKNSKYSLVPIIPALVKSNYTLQKMLTRMKQGGTNSEGVNIPVGEAVFASTFKLGANQLNDVDSNEPLMVTEFHNEHWLRPQITTQKVSNESGLGAQIRAMMMGNLPVHAIFGGRTATQHAQAYDDAIATIVDSSVEESQESITDANDMIDKAKLATETISHLEKTSVDGIVPRHVKLIRKVRTGVVTATRLKQVSSSIQKMLAKKTRDNIKIKLAGFQAVQVTPLGHTTFAKTEGSTSKELNMAHIDSETGEVVAAEIMVSPHYFLTELQKRLARLKSKGVHAERSLNKLGNVTQTASTAKEIQRLTDEMTDIASGIKSINSTIVEMKSETFDITQIPETLLEVIAYRVPTQEKSSFLPCKIVAFTAHSKGQQIIVPAEFTTSSGSDYDIDKLFLVFDEMDVSSSGEFVNNIGNDKVRNAKRTVKRMMMDTIMHPEVFKSVVDVNSTDAIKEHDALLAKLSPERFGKDTVRNKIWGAMSTQNDLRLANQASSRGISDSMVYLKGIQVYNRIGLNLGVVSDRQRAANRKIRSLISERDDAIASSPLIVRNKVVYTNGSQNITLTTYNDGSVTRKDGRKKEVRYENSDMEGANIVGVEEYTSHRVRVSNAEVSKDIMKQYEKKISAVDATDKEFANYKEEVVLDLFPTAGISIYPNTEEGQEVTSFGDDASAVGIGTTKVFESGKMYDFVATSDLVGKQEKDEFKSGILDAISAGAQARVTGELAQEIAEEAMHLDMIPVEGGIALVPKKQEDLDLSELSTTVIHGKINDKVNFAKFTVNGKIPKMSNLTEAEAAEVARAFVAWSSAALDSPEMTGRYNINEVTKDAFGYLSALGDTGYALLVLNHPSVVEFVSEVAKFSTERPFDAVRLAKEKMGATLAYADMTSGELQAAYSDEAMGTQVLSNFLALADIGNNLYKLFISSNSDTKGVHSNASHSVLKGEALKKIRGTNSFAKAGKFAEENNAFTIDNGMYNDHHVSSYEEIVTNHLNNIGSVAIEGTPGFLSTVKTVESITGRKLTARQRITLEADVYTYLMTNESSVLNVSSEKAASLFLGNNTVLKQLKKVLEMSKLKNVESNGNYSRNGVIQRLTPRKEKVVLDKTEYVMEFVDFDSRAWSDNPQSLQNDVINDFTKLLEDPNEDVRSFAIDLIRADMLRSGSSYSLSSIAPVIPDEFYTNTYEQTGEVNGETVTRKFESIDRVMLNEESNIMTSEGFGIGGMGLVEQFIGNRYELLGIPDITRSNAEAINNTAKTSKIAILGNRVVELNKGKVVPGSLVKINDINKTFLPMNQRHRLTIDQANAVEGIDQKHCLF